MFRYMFTYGVDTPATFCHLTKYLIRLINNSTIRGSLTRVLDGKTSSLPPGSSVHIQGQRLNVLLTLAFGGCGVTVTSRECVNNTGQKMSSEGRIDLRDALEENPQVIFLTIECYRSTLV